MGHATRQFSTCQITRWARQWHMVGIIVALLSVVACGPASGTTQASRQLAPLATATRVPVPTASASPTPAPPSAFTCAAGSLPVQPATAPSSCSVSTRDNAQVVFATYSGRTIPFINDYALTAAGWLLAANAHGDGAVTSSGYGAYFFQSAWLVDRWTASSDSSSSLTIEAGFPQGDQPIACGQTPAVGAAQVAGVVLPESTRLALDGNMPLVPACADDVRRFFESSLAAAGWTETQTFAYISNQTLSGTFNRGGTTIAIALSGYPGTSTLILIAAQP